MTLTDRDLQLLRNLNDFGVLTTNQLCALHFHTLHRTRKRMRLLWSHRLAARHVRPVRMGDGSSQFLYTLTRKGLRALANDKNEKPHSNKFNRSLATEHTIRVNDFRIALIVALRDSTDVVLSGWRHDRELSFPVPLSGDGRTRRVSVIPDAFVVFTVRGRKFGYFVEIDRGTTDLGRIQEKMLAYLSMWKSALASQLGVRSFRVLYVTSFEKRQSNMLDALARIPSSHRRDIINITSASQFSLLKPELLFTAIWQTVDHFGKHRTVSPLPSLIPSELPTASGNPLVRGPDTGAR